MIKAWFSLISAILVVSLFTLLYNFNLINILHWVSLIVLTIAIIMTMIVYLEKPHKNQSNDLEKIYSEFLKEKDRKIEELQEKSGVLFKTAMKKAENNVELAELKRRYEERLKENAEN